MKNKEYKIYSEKIKTEKNIAICSDIHISQQTKKEKLIKILDTLNEIKPTHIVLPGDLYNVDTTTVYGDGYYNDNLKKFINELTEIADTYYVRGNNEISSYFLPKWLINNTNQKIHVLCEEIDESKNRYFKTEDMTISGIKFDSNFYRLNENNKCSEIIYKYTKYLEKLSKHCGSKDFNILLCHDPIIQKAMLYYKNYFLKKFNFDLIISGHNHGGLFPEWMRPLLKLAGTNIEQAYPTYTKGMIINGKNQYHIISEGITKFHSNSESLKILENYCEGTIENVRILKK